MGGGGSGSSSADDWNLGPNLPEGVQVGGPFGGDIDWDALENDNVGLH